MNDDQLDAVIRVFNNVALAKNGLLANRPDDALRKLDAALSWSMLALGVEHPMASVVAPASQPPLLDHEGKFLTALDIEIPNDQCAKQLVHQWVVKC